MENLRKKSKTDRGTTDLPDQSSIGADTVEKSVDHLQSSSSINDKSEINAVDEHCHQHHHHESLDVEVLENSSSASPLQHEELIRERDGELNESKRINDSYKQELLLLSKENRMKQLTVENNKLKDENIASHLEQNDENKIVIDKYQSKIDDSELLSNNSNENDFNDNCWLKIFSYLSIDDMMQIKRVCKKWYQVSQKWFEQVQTLEYAENFYGFGSLELREKYRKRNRYLKRKITNFNDPITTLHSCGHHIKYYKAKFSSINKTKIEERNKFLFQWVPKLCKNIVKVHIDGNKSTYTPSNFEAMANHWRKLEKLNINDLPQLLEENFHQLLHNNKQLKILKLKFRYDRACPLNDKFFNFLPTTIEKMTLENMSIDNKKQLSHFVSASKNFTSLKLFKLSGLPYLADAVISAIADINSITNLSLSDVYHYESRRKIDCIGNMKNLKVLYFKNNPDLHEYNVIKIVENCIQLEALFIWEDDVLSDRGLIAIAEFKKLKCLDVDMESMTTESIIRSCESLEVWWCTHSRMTDKDVINLVRRATNLRFLDLTVCINLTKAVLVAANEIANERKNNILCITGHEIFYDIDDDIDTPYFKFIENIFDVPMELFPENIAFYIESRTS